MDLNNVCEKENVHLPGLGCVRVGISKQDVWDSLWMV